jgi:hypothetical protein
MGLTVACARCHDHKFDPIPTRDYYGLAGIFFSTHILPKLTPKGAGETPLRIPLLTRADAAKREAYAAQVHDLETRRKATAETAYQELAQSLVSETARYVTAAWEYAHRPDDQAALTLTDFAQRRGLHAYALRRWAATLGWRDARLMSTPVVDLLGNRGVQTWKGAADTPSLTVNTNATARTILTFTLPPRSVAVHPGPSSGVGVGWKSPLTGTVRVTGRVIDGDPAGGDGIAWVIERQGRSSRLPLASGDFPNGGRQEFSQGQGAERLHSIPIRTGETLRLIVLPKANYICDTTVTELEITDAQSGKTWNLTRDLVGDPHQGNPHRDSYGNAAVWSFCDMGEEAGSAGGDISDHPAVRAWQVAVADLAPEEGAKVEAAAQILARALPTADSHSPFRIGRREDEGELPTARREELAKLDETLAALAKSPPPPIPYANGAQEGGVPESSQAGFHDVRVHHRGSYLQLGDLVPRHFPVVLAGESQPPITQGSGRLELARWLASKTHPLTARVMVNRIWQHHFGEGIVRTPSNFGFLGERPTHPELLDWLAARFMEEGWSIKRMHRLIMLSATYQQSAEPDGRALRLDPGNRLWGRMNRQRLEAEAIRDNLIAVTGQLDTTPGGVGTRDFNVPRRTLYMMTVRSDRTGFGSLFDAADSTSSADHRTASTVAPQGLYLLNDAFVLTQAHHLADRLGREVPHDPAARIQRAYLLLYGRPATPLEVKVGTGLLARMAGTKGGNTARAGAVGERPAPALAVAQSKETTAPPASGSSGYANEAEAKAWQAYCQVLLCTNEFIYID